MKSRLDGIPLRGVEVASIADPASVHDGLAGHLVQQPSFVLVAGGQRRGRPVAPGAVRHVLGAVQIPVLLVPDATEQEARVHHAADAGIETGAER